jgi:hypothetical protein
MRDTRYESWLEWSHLCKNGEFGRFSYQRIFLKGRPALAWARTLAQAFSVEIVVLHVLELPVTWTPLGGLGSLPTSLSTESVERLTSEAQTILETVAQDAPEVTRRLLRKDIRERSSSRWSRR